MQGEWKDGRRMQQRTLTAILAIPVVLGLMAWPGGVPAVIAAGVVLTLAFAEFTSMCNTSGVPCRLWWGAIGILLLVLWTQGRVAVPPDMPEIALVVVWMLAIVETGRRGRRPVAAIGPTLLGILWIGGLGAAFVLVRFHQPRDPFTAFGLESGAWAVIALLLMVWALDIAAYFFGRKVGGTPLAPGISPKKTIEGAAGGFLAATLMGAVTAPLFSFTTGGGLLVGACIGVAGQIGDLFESAVKRELGFKDSGSALPGHGGWLDRIDALLFASGVMAWFLLRGPGG